MSTVSLNKVGVTKVASLLVFAAVAMVFFAFPLATNAMCGKTKVATTLAGGLGVADKAVTKLGTTFTLSGVFLDQAGNPVACPSGSATGWCIGTTAGTSSPVSFLPFATGKVTSLAPGEWIGIVPPGSKTMVEATIMDSKGLTVTIPGKGSPAVWGMLTLPANVTMLAAGGPGW